jgi:hypothetical protein
MIVGAINEANAVKTGTAPRGELGPWRVQPVSVEWVGRERQEPLPPCNELFYLGEGNGRVALYDSQHQQTLRINGAEIQLSFPDDCH